MERNDAMIARERNKRLLERYEAGETIEALAAELVCTRKQMARRLERARKARAGLKSYDPLPASTNNRREVRFDMLKRTPYRALSGVQVRMIVEGTGGDLEALAAEWGVTPTEIKYRAGLV